MKGFYCPMPVLKAREEITKLPLGSLLTIIADDPAAEEDLKRWAKRAGQEILDISRKNGEVKVVIRRVK